MRVKLLDILNILPIDCEQTEKSQNIKYYPHEVSSQRKLEHRSTNIK